MTQSNPTTPQPTDDDVDGLLRHLSRMLPDSVATGLVPGATVVGWEDTQLTTTQRRMDRTLILEVNTSRRWLHLEWQLKWEAMVPFRVFEYQVCEVMLLGNQSPPILEPEVESHVILLTGRQAIWPRQQQYRFSVPGEPVSQVSFTLHAVYQQTVQQLLDQGLFWAGFAPLAVDADEARMVEVIEKVRAKSPTEQMFADITGTMLAMADVDGRHRGLRPAILQTIPEELVMSTWIYQQGEQRGEQRGLQKGILPLLQLFALKMGREISAQEQQLLLDRLNALGPTRLAALVLEKDGPALDAWLNDPSAT